MKIIGGEFRNRILKAPKNQRTRPTQSSVREALFNMTQSYIEGAIFLDCFAGSGAIGFEALSRGAAKVLFIEKDRAAQNCIQENAKTLQVPITLLKLDYKIALTKLPPIDIAYFDPPYEDQAAYTYILQKASSFMKPGSHLFLEASKNQDLPINSPCQIKTFGDTKLYHLIQE